MAHVLGIVGIAGAFGAGAAADRPYAAESLTGTAPYAIMGSPMGKIVLDVEVDTLIESEDDYYMVVNFWSAELTAELGLVFTIDPHADNQDTEGVMGNPNSTPPVATTQPMVGNGTGFRFYTVTESVRPSVTGADPEVTGVDGRIVPVTGVSLTRAFRGDESDSAGVYKMEITTDIAIDTRIRLDLSSNLAIPTKSGSYRGDLYIYDNLGDARAAARAGHPNDVPNNNLVSGYNALFSVASKIAPPTITPMLATADVGYERTGDDENNVSSGGPFRGFTDGLGNVGIFASIKLNEAMDNPATTMVDESVYLNAVTGQAYEALGNTDANFTVSSEVDGAFGFGTGAGDGPNGESKRTGDNPATDETETDHVLNAGGAPKAFRIATSDDCTGGKPLVLSADGTDINPLDDDDPTFSSEADGGEAKSVSGTAFYFCVDVSENEVAIPDVGDDRMMDGYKMTVQALHGTAPGPSTTGNAGAIDRNGTTLNITYLSDHPAYNQRLVIVNRGSRPAEYWMDTFQTEANRMVPEGTDIRGTVMGKSRMVIRVQDLLEVTDLMGNEVTNARRASGTLNLTAPERNIDVMTLQVYPGTGQIDTTIYQAGQ